VSHSNPLLRRLAFFARRRYRAIFVGFGLAMAASASWSPASSSTPTC
jgi:hypothetical protein